MDPKHEETRGDVLRGGLIAGTLGGSVMALILVAPVVGNMENAWPSLRVASYPFIGPQVFHPGFSVWPLILGTLVHFAVSMAWALLFTWVVHAWRGWWMVAASVPYGAFVWLVMHHIVVPLLRAGVVINRVPPTISIVQHVAFGLTLGLTLALLQPQRWRIEAPPRSTPQT